MGDVSLKLNTLRAFNLNTPRQVEIPTNLVFQHVQGYWGVIFRVFNRIPPLTPLVQKHVFVCARVATKTYKSNRVTFFWKNHVFLQQCCTKTRFCYKRFGMGHLSWRPKGLQPKYAQTGWNTHQLGTSTCLGVFRLKTLSVFSASLWCKTMHFQVLINIFTKMRCFLWTHHFASKKSVCVLPENKRDFSLTRLVQEGFLLHYLKVSGPVWPVEAPPDVGSRSPQPWERGAPSLRC